MPVIDDLVAYWPLDEASGDALDAHGSLDLTDNNTVGTDAGIVGNARDFEDANNERFTHVDDPDLSAGDTDFTCQVWLKLESLPSVIEIHFQKGTGGTIEYNMAVNASGELRWSVYDSSFNEYRATWSPNLSTGTWYLVHGWHDSVNNQVGVVVNAGTPVTTSTGGAAPADAGGTFILGNRPDLDFPYDGLLDEVALWRRVLSSADRTWLYNAGAGRSYADLVAEGGGGAAVGYLLVAA